MQTKQEFIALLDPAPDGFWEPKEIWRLKFQYAGIEYYEVLTLNSRTELFVMHRQPGVVLRRIRRHLREIFRPLPRIKSDINIAIWSDEPAYFERIARHDNRISASQRGNWDWPRNWQAVQVLVRDWKGL